MKEITVEARTDNLSAVTDFVNEALEAADCSLKAMTQIDLALDELFSNIANYAYGPAGGEATIRVETQTEPRAVQLTFLDRGVPYDPLAKEDPDTSLSADDREIGGLGIFLVKRIMDELSYEYRDGQNILRVRKYL